VIVFELYLVCANQGRTDRCSRLRCHGAAFLGPVIGALRHEASLKLDPQSIPMLIWMSTRLGLTRQSIPTMGLERSQG
jgi:hypothetical protein